MDALGHDLRIRFSAIFEWTVAALFLCATIGVGSLILHALFTPIRPVPQAATTEPARPPTVSAGADLVWELPLSRGRILRTGTTLPSTAALLGRAAETGRQEVDPGRLGERLTRFYEQDGVRFALVFEPVEPDGGPRLTAIYVIR